MTVMNQSSLEERSAGHPCDLRGKHYARQICIKKGFRNERQRPYSFDAGYQAEDGCDGSCQTAQHLRAACGYCDVLARYKPSGHLSEVGCAPGVFLIVVRERG